MIYLEKEDGTKTFVRNFGEGKLHMWVHIAWYNEFTFDLLTVQFTLS